MDRGHLHALLGLPEDASPTQLRAEYERAVNAAAKAHQFSRAAELSLALDQLPLPTRQAMYPRHDLGADGAFLTTSSRPRRRTVQRPARQQRTGWFPSPVFLALIAATVIGGVFAGRDPATASQSRVGVFAFVVAAWLVSVCLHEFAHAFVAFRGGDRSVVDAGYLRLNPFKYAHPLLSVGLPLLWIAYGGIGLPGGAVMIHRHALRSRAWASAVSASGPLVNIATAAITLAFIPHGDNALDAIRANLGIYSALAFFAWLQIAVAVLNLMPIPGLDGWGVIEPWLPESTVFSARKLQPFGFLILIALLSIPRLSAEFGQLVTTIATNLGDPEGLPGVGLELFRFWTHLSQ